MAPDANALHPLRATSPQECEVIHSYTFQSQEFLATAWVPSYEEFLKSADFKPVYAFQKKFLQFMHRPGAPRQWVLKSPDHAHSVAALLAVFPDAIIIQTHRSPADVLASSLQLVEMLHRLFARREGEEKRAMREARVLVESVEQMLYFRESHPELARRFLDVNYADLVADPLTAVERIYAHCGKSLSPSVADRMRAVAAGKSRYQRRRVRSGADQIASTLAVELRRLEPYCRRFGFQPSPLNPSLAELKESRLSC
jgi:hypothetical protein